MLDHQWRACLANERTVNGRVVVLPHADEQNFTRYALSLLQARFIDFMRGARIEGRLGAIDATLGNQIRAAIDVLPGQITNPVHYEDNSPALFTADGVPVLPDPEFTYWDLLGFGLSGPDGQAGFLRDCGLPADVSASALDIAVGLLLVDSAVAELERDRPHRAAMLATQAADCAEVCQLARLRSVAAGQGDTVTVEAISKVFTEMGARGGQASAEARAAKAKATPEKVAQIWNELKGTGTKEEHEFVAVIASRLGVQPNSVHKVIPRAEKKGLITRTKKTGLKPVE